MRIAIVSDIHGNRAAFEAVLADLRQTSPDLVLHGGDLADAGSSPAWVVDRIRDLGWEGVLGNTDEMLVEPDSLETFACRSQSPSSLFSAIRDMAAATREALGEERLSWLRVLPRAKVLAPFGLVHASPADAWRAPGPDGSDAELDSAYRPLGQPIAVYGHIHRPYVRHLDGLIVANAGSVSLSHDGDPRAAYLLLDDSTPVIRRVEYDVYREIDALRASRLPHVEWVARMLAEARPQMP